MKRKQKMKESSECIVRKGDNKETKKCRWKKSRSIHGDSEGGKKRQAEKQTEVEKRGRVTRGEKEQKMDTVSQYGKGGGRKGWEDG